MNEHIPAPIKGEPTRASWGRAVTEVCNSVRAAGFSGALVRDGAGAFGNAPLPQNNRNRLSAVRPHVFEVRWNADANNKAGAWMIFVPDDCSLMYAGEYIVPGGTAALPELEGWMSVSDSGKQSTGIFLNITAADDASATISSTAAGDLSVRIAAVSYDEQTSHAQVTQDVVGKLVIGPVRDEKSTGKSSGKLEIFGWATQSAEKESLASRLDSTAPYEMELVARDGGPAGELRYIPIGSFFKKSEEGGEETVIPTVNPTAQIVGDIMYDTSDHQLKKRIDTVDLRTGAVVQGNWVMITGGQATPHSGETA